MALVVGMQVGSGIFSSPGVVVASVGSTGASLLVWLISGLLAWTGARWAVEVAELTEARSRSWGVLSRLVVGLRRIYLMPCVRSGGELTPVRADTVISVYLVCCDRPQARQRCYHRFDLWVWSATEQLADPREYINRMIYHAISGDSGTVPEWTFKVTGVFAILIISALNLISPTAGTHSAVVFTTIKIGSLIFIGVLGLIYLVRNGPGPSFLDKGLFEGSSTNPGDYALALYSGLWAFDGWDQCSVSSEILIQLMPVRRRRDDQP